MEEAAKYAYVSSIHFAVLHAQLGQNDRAFAWLEKAFEERQPWLGQLQFDPQFEPRRSDPRFSDLVRRIERGRAARRRSLEPCAEGELYPLSASPWPSLEINLPGGSIPTDERRDY